MANHLIASVNVICGDGRCGKTFAVVPTHREIVCPHCLWACEPLVHEPLRQYGFGLQYGVPVDPLGRRATT